MWGCNSTRCMVESKQRARGASARWGSRNQCSLDGWGQGPGFLWTIRGGGFAEGATKIFFFAIYSDFHCPRSWVFDVLNLKSDMYKNQLLNTGSFSGGEQQDRCILSTKPGLKYSTISKKYLPSRSASSIILRPPMFWQSHITFTD